MAEQELYRFAYKDDSIDDEEMSAIMYQLMEWRPHTSAVYTWDDLGIANLMTDAYEKSTCYCPQNKDWYVRNGRRWEKQSEDGLIHDKLETLLNLLLLYCKEQLYLTEHNDSLDKEHKDSEIEIILAYEKYVKSIRKFTAMRNIISVFATKVRINIADFDTNPYILNTTNYAYDLRTGEIVHDLDAFNVTMCAATRLPDFMTTPCQRWYDFIDEITSRDKEKARFLQRALGYSLLGVNKDECMFVAYGSRSRNGKGTLFTAIEKALGPDYMKSASPKLICEKSNGDSIDFNAPQPMLAALLGARLVNMSEAQQGVRLDSAAMKAMTGRDTLTTRGLYEKPFSFVPQFTLWLNTNYLPTINDDTVFLSDRVWVIEFNEHFDDSTRDVDLKEIFAKPENRPTILKWLFDGCLDYIENGLNPPECVRKATNSYRYQNDRIGRFMEECCDMTDPKAKTLRGDVYQSYRAWCNKGDNRYKPLGSTSFYVELSVRGYSPHKSNGEWVVQGMTLKPIQMNGRITL